MITEALIRGLEDVAATSGAKASVVKRLFDEGLVVDAGTAGLRLTPSGLNVLDAYKIGRRRWGAR